VSENCASIRPLTKFLSIVSSICSSFGRIQSAQERPSSTNTVIQAFSRMRPLHTATGQSRNCFGSSTS